jgi:hypothetical protein
MKARKFLEETRMGEESDILTADLTSFAAFGGIYFQNGCNEEIAKGNLKKYRDAG